VKKSTLKGTRNNHEYELVELLHEAIEKDVEVILLADRGFGDHKLYEFLEGLGWDFVIRFRGCIGVQSAAGETRAAEDWVPANGRATMLRNVAVTGVRAAIQRILATLPQHPLRSNVAVERKRVAAALSREWPREAGPLVTWRLALPAGAPAVVEIVHSGPSLGAAGAALFGGDLSRDLATRISIRDIVVSPEPVVAEPGAGLAWLAAARPSLDVLDAVEALHGCVEAPQGKKGKAAGYVEPILAALRRSPGFQSGRLRIDQGAHWRAVVSLAPCTEPRNGDAASGVGDGGAEVRGR
jgi:hypothetical protein